MIYLTREYKFTPRRKAKMLTPFKVKHQNEIVAQFGTLPLAIYFVKSISNLDFVLTYEYRKILWDTFKEGNPIDEIITKRFNEIKSKERARWEKLMETCKQRSEEEKSA